MLVKRGTTRTVILFESVAVKLPRIQLVRAFRLLNQHRKAGRLLECLRLNAACFHSPQHLMFKGILDNWQEFRFYQRTRSAFLMPTYLSLLGFMNIQKSGKMPASITENALWGQLRDITKAACWADSHAFSNPNNFCVEDGHLKMVDYAGVRAQNVIERYGDRIFQEFDISACIKTEK
jgi:hypothetical protein